VPQRSSGLRTFNRIGCVALIALVLALPVIGYFQAVREAEADLAALKKRLRAEGILVPVEQLIPKVPKGEQNAADLYRQAFAALSITSQESDTLYHLPQSSRERQRLLLEVVARNQPSYDLVDRASHVTYCAFPRNWADPYSVVTSPSGYIHMVIALCYRIEALDALGRPEAALDAAGVGFAAIEHLRGEPTVAAQLLAYIEQSRLIEALNGILSHGSPSPAACRRLFGQLASVDQLAPLARAIQGEMVVFDMAYYAQIARGGCSPGQGTSASDALVMSTYGTVGRFLLHRDQMTRLREMTEVYEAARLPWPAAQQHIEAAEQTPYSVPAYESVITRNKRRAGQGQYLYANMILARDERGARIALAQIALAAKAFQHSHRRYPESLAELEADNWKVPDDPFTGKSLPYRREGQGFVVWSLGPNMVDDNAVKYDSKTISSADGPYDIVLRVKR